MKVQVVVLGKSMALAHMANSDYNDSQGQVLNVSHV
jgi:hypothetical protein